MHGSLIFPRSDLTSSFKVNASFNVSILVLELIFEKFYENVPADFLNIWQTINSVAWHQAICEQVLELIIQNHHENSVNVQVGKMSTQSGMAPGK
jgi:hypothetical protein